MKEEIYNHRTKEGKEIPLNELETSHLKNIIALQKRKAIAGIIICEYVDPSDCWAIIEQSLYGAEALELMNHHLYVNELKRRLIGSKQL